MSDEWVNDYDKKLEQEAKLDAQADVELKERYPQGESTGNSEYVTDLENYLLGVDGFARCHCCQKVGHVDGMERPTVDIGTVNIEADFLVCEDCI